MGPNSSETDTTPNTRPASDTGPVRFGSQSIPRRLLLFIGLVGLTEIAAGLNLVLNPNRRRNSESSKNPENGEVHGTILAFFDENGSKIDPKGGMPGNSFSFFLAERTAPDVSIVAVETTVGGFKGEIPDDRDHPGQPGWPIVSHDEKPVDIISGQAIFLVTVDMNDVNGNNARDPGHPNVIPYGDTFKLSVNTTVEYHGREIILYETPGEILLKRQPQK